MPPRRRKTLSSPSSTVDSVPLSTTEQSLRSTPATSEADSEKPARRRPTRPGASTKGTKKRARDSSDEDDPLAMEEEEGPFQKVAKRAIKRRATTNRAYVEIPIREKFSVCPVAPYLPCGNFTSKCTGLAPSSHSSKRGQQVRTTGMLLYFAVIIGSLNPVLAFATLPDGTC